MKTRAFLAVLLLAPTSALATASWTTSFAGGSAVMGEISSISFTVTNTSNGGELLNSITLQLNQNEYDVDGGLAPPGWQVATVDKLVKRITYTACPGGLAPGASATFTMMVIGAPANADQAGEALVTTGNGNKTFATIGCLVNSPTVNLASSPSWRRIGIGATMSISPSSMSTGRNVTVTLTVTNRSTSDNATISPSTVEPAIWDSLTGAAAPGAAFTLQNSPSPSSLVLDQDETGVFQWVYRANNQGVFNFTASARNGTGSLTSLTARSTDLATGQFPGTISIFPEKIVSGGSVRVTFSVRNNSSTQILNVTPTQPSVVGSVTATRTSGPSPESVTSLPPGAAASFVYDFTVTGAPGVTFQFTGIGSASRDGFPITSDPVGSAEGLIGTHTVTANPTAVMSASGSVAVAYTILNGGGQDITQARLLDPDGHFVPANSPWSADGSGWTAGNHVNNKRYWPISSPNTASNLHNTAGANTKTFTFTYSSISAVPVNTKYTHRFELVQADTSTIRVEAPIAIILPRTVAPSSLVTAVATNGKVGLAWNYPANDHDGTLVVRAQGASPSTAPANGRRYSPGETLGNATVVYSDLQSYASTFSDTSVVNGQPYFYKVFNHDEFHQYASGDVPTSAGVLAIPSAPPSGPAWCYSTGLLTTQQPYTDFGVGVYTSSQASAFTGNSISSDPTLDGTERWRPVPTTGVTQARPTVTSFNGRSGRYVVIGDQLGYTYAIDVSSGQVLWNGNGGASIGAVQAQASVMLHDSTSTSTDAGIAYRGRYPNTDLVFFGTRTASTTANRIWALQGSDGMQKWSLLPGNLDIISGGMVVDYKTNRLWVASRAGGGPSLRVIDILNPGNPAVTFSGLGDIDNAVIRNSNLGEIHVVNNSGQAYGFDPVTMTQRWTYNLGGQVAGYLVPVNGGFIASTPGGVQRYAVTATAADGGTTYAVAPVWASPTAISGPSAARLDATVAPFDLYVADATGKVNRIDYVTGALEGSFTVSTTGLGMPSIDPTTTPKRLFVGGQDGRMCAINLPF